MGIERTSHKPNVQHTLNKNTQTGAALYVSLVILIVLALLGVIGMKVITNQEVMTSSHTKRTAAFERAEGNARSLETTIEKEINQQSKIYASDSEDCTQNFDALSWSRSKNGADATYVRKIDKCYTASGSSLVLGKKINNEGNTNNVYEVTTTAGDKSSNAESVAVINTIYIP